MKQIRKRHLALTLAAVAASSAIPAVALAATAATNDSNQEEKAMSTTVSNARQETTVLSTTVTFRPDRVYEVTGIWVRDGKLDQLDAYFAEVFPIALEDYGVRPLFSLEPLSVYAGDFEPQVMFVNEWPSLESFEGFIADRRARALFPRRDEAVSRLVVSHYTVPEEVTVELADGAMVEFGAMWIKSGRETELAEYYRTVMPLAREHGLTPITPLAVVSSYSGDFLPSRAGLNLWGSLSNFESFAAAASEHFPRRDAALARLDVTHAAVRLEGAR